MAYILVGENRNFILKLINIGGTMYSLENSNVLEKIIIHDSEHYYYGIKLGVAADTSLF